MHIKTKNTGHKTLLKMAGFTLLLSLIAYFVCSFLLAPQYHTRAYFRVGYNHLPDDFYHQLIRGNTYNLAQELHDVINDDETYALAAFYSSVDEAVVKDAVSVYNAGGIAYETLIIACSGSKAGQVYAITNGYLRALDEVLTKKTTGSASFMQSTNQLIPAPFPTDETSPQSLPIVVLTAIISLIVSYVLFSGKKVSESLIQILCVLVFAAFIFPFYHILINSISDNDLSLNGKILFLPHQIQLDNYRSLFSDHTLGIADSICVTLLRSGIGTLLMLLVSAWAAYILSLKNLWKRRFWYYFIMMPLFFQAGLFPWLINMEMLGLKNNFLGYILPAIVSPGAILLIKYTVEKLPKSLNEEAMIEGCGTVQYFLRVILPMSVPVLVAIGISVALSHWNSFQDSLLLMTDNTGLQSLPHKLYLLIQQLGIQDHEITASERTQVIGKYMVFALSVLSFLPVVILYPFAHQLFMRGIKLSIPKE